MLGPLVFLLAATFLPGPPVSQLLLDCSVDYSIPPRGLLSTMVFLSKPAKLDLSFHHISSVPPLLELLEAVFVMKDSWCSDWAMHPWYPVLKLPTWQFQSPKRMRNSGIEILAIISRGLPRNCLFRRHWGQTEVHWQIRLCRCPCQLPFPKDDPVWDVNHIEYVDHLAFRQ